MKPMKHYLTLCLAITVLLMSCGKDDEMNPDDPLLNGDGFMTCKIDGVDFSASPITVGGIVSGNNFTVQGNGAGLDASAISMALNSSYNGVGVYRFGSDFLFNIGTYIPKASDPINSFTVAAAGTNVGQIEITKDDGEFVEGTFSFECVNQNDQSQRASITEGQFRLKLP